MTERRLQDILDANTAHIPEFLYIQLSNEVMHLHNQNNRHPLTRNLVDEQQAHIIVLSRALEDANVREASLRRQLHDFRSGREMERLKEELNLRIKLNADRVESYKRQIDMYSKQLDTYREHVTSFCSQIVEYRAKVKDLSDKLERVKTEVKETTPVHPGNRWVSHAKDWAKRHNTSYTQALRDPACKGAYWNVAKQRDPAPKAGNIKRISELCDP